MKVDIKEILNIIENEGNRKLANKIKKQYNIKDQKYTEADLENDKFDFIKTQIARLIIMDQVKEINTKIEKAYQLVDNSTRMDNDLIEKLYSSLPQERIYSTKFKHKQKQECRDIAKKLVDAGKTELTSKEELEKLLALM